MTPAIQRGFENNNNSSCMVQLSSLRLQPDKCECQLGRDCGLHRFHNSPFL